MSDEHSTLYQMAARRAAGAHERRWEGVLTPAQMARMQAFGATLAYDPAQIGWVRLEDGADAAPLAEAMPPAPLSWRAGLAGPTIRLRDWTMADVATYRAMLDDADLWRYLPETWPGVVTDDLAADLIRIAQAAPHHSVQAVLQGDQPVGQVRLHFIDNAETVPTAPQIAEISYWFGRAHWGKGLGRRVVRLATAQGFGTYPSLQRIIAHVHPQNGASAKVLEHAGYHETCARADGWRVFHINR